MLKSGLYASRARRASADINVVPYIDVMLVLLVILMATAPLLSQTIPLKLPKTPPIGAPKAEDLSLIVVSVDEKGQYYLLSSLLEGVATPSGAPQPIAADRLSQAVQAALARAREQSKAPPAIWVKGDARVDYGKVVAAMSILQQAGISQIGLVTEVTQNRPNNAAR